MVCPKAGYLLGNCLGVPLKGGIKSGRCRELFQTPSLWRGFLFYVGDGDGSLSVSACQIAFRTTVEYIVHEERLFNVSLLGARASEKSESALHGAEGRPGLYEGDACKWTPWAWT